MGREAVWVVALASCLAAAPACDGKGKAPSKTEDDDGGGKKKKGKGKEDEEPKGPTREAFDQRLDGGTGKAQVTVIVTGPDGDIFVGGEVDAGTELLGAKAATGGAFIARLGVDGSPTWIQWIRSESMVDPSDIAVADDGTSYVVGSGWGTFDIGTGPQKYVNGVQPGFVASFDAKGEPRWVQSSPKTWVHDVVLDGDGHLFVAGGFQRRIELGETSLSGTKTIGRMSSYVASLSTDGEYRWAKKLGDEMGVGDMTIEGGKLQLTGGFSGTLDLGGGPLKAPPGGGRWVARFDADGEHVSSELGDRPSDLPGLTVRTARDGKGNLYATAGFKGPVDLGGGKLPSHPGAYDVYVAKFDPSGEHLWSHAWGSTGDDVPKAIAVDEAGQVAVVGKHEATIDFGGGPLEAQGRDSGFVLKLDADGKHVFSHAIVTAKSDWCDVARFEPGGSLLVGCYVDATYHASVATYANGGARLLRYVD